MSETGRARVFSAALLASAVTFSPPAWAQLKFGLENYLSAEHRQPSESTVNPKNSVLKIPSYAAETDLRPEISYQSESTKWLARPRYLFGAREWSEGDPAHSRQIAEGRLNLTDAYVEWRQTETFRTTAGLENYQWGSAELFNASNPLYHLSTVGRSAFFKEKGQALVRFSHDTTTKWNNMLVLNPVSNNEPAWQDEGRFHSGGFLKSELRAQDGAKYFGFLAGRQNDGRQFAGEYAAYAFENGWSVYLDGRHMMGTRRFFPRSTPFGSLSDLETDDSRISTLGVLGARWEGRFDARVEYLHNSEGFARDEFKTSLDAIRDAGLFSLLNLKRLLQPGLEMYGRHYGYASIRIPDLGRKKDISVAARTLASLQDGSALVQGTFEKPLTESTVVLAETSTTLGDRDLEMTLFDRFALLAGLRWTL